MALSNQIFFEMPKIKISLRMSHVYDIQFIVSDAKDFYERRFEFHNLNMGSVNHCERV